MNLSTLKNLRRVASVLILAGVSLIFLDPGGVLPSWMLTVIGAFQLLPALTKVLVGVSLSTVGVTFIVVLTLLIGRVYCSSLCPLGTLQDLVIRVAEQRRGKRRFIYRRPQYALHYSVLAITAVAFAGGSLVLLNALEPFSTYGRLLQGVVRPALIWSINALAFSLTRFDIYSLSPYPLFFEAGWAFVIAVLLSGVIIFMAYHHGRLFCNVLCPAGALLGLLSRYSLFRIVIDESACKACGLCEKACKAQCIDTARKHIDYAACVSCFNCLHVCPTVGIKYEEINPLRGIGKPEPVVPGRRSFLAGAAAMVTGSAQVQPDSLGGRLGVIRQSAHPVTPPGSRSVDHFSSHCTACHLCVSVCPPQVLRPAFLEYGIAGVFQPRMDYWSSYCSYECALCTSVCPTGAILPLSVEEKKLVQLGKATFIRDDCIVITKKTDCGACSEHCPTKAVRMIPHEKLMLPEVTDEFCIGCGACEKACPTKPRKAIFVESHPIHGTAKAPVIQQQKEPAGELQEFPF
jgi:ferredoxin